MVVVSCIHKQIWLMLAGVSGEGERGEEKNVYLLIFITSLNSVSIKHLTWEKKKKKKEKKKKKKKKKRKKKKKVTSQLSISDQTILNLIKPTLLQFNRLDF